MYTLEFIGSCNLANEGFGELFVDGPNIGLVKYEGSHRLVDVIKVVVQEGSETMHLVGPITIDVQEERYDFIDMGIGDGFLILEYRPHPLVEVIGWAADVSGGLWMGNSEVYLKVISLDDGYKIIISSLAGMEGSY